MLEDPRQVGQRLDVVHDGRLAVQADRRREVGGLQAGHSTVALEALDEGRLLADDVGTGSPVEDDVHGEVGTQDLAPHVAGGIGLVQGGGDPLLGECHLAAHVQEALRQAEGVAGDQATLDELVGVALHEEAVLVGTGFALVAVHDQVPGPDALRAEPPLDACWEAGAAATQQGRFADLAVDVGRSLRQRSLQAHVPAGGLETGERVGVLVAEARGDQLRPAVVDVARCVGDV